MNTNQLPAVINEYSEYAPMVDLTGACIHCLFTDAELAAELWHSVSYEAEAEVRGRRPGGDVDYWSKINRESVRQTKILERFVSMPSYDEDPA